MTSDSIAVLLRVEGIDDPLAAIRRRARALVERALSMGWHGPPFDVNEVASLCGMKVENRTDLAPDQDACVMLQRILVNATKPRRRRRYSVAHEIGHTLFPDYEEELRRIGRMYRRIGDDTELERLCQAAAAEILMPLDAFVKSTKTLNGRTLCGVFALSDLYDVSTEAAIRRVVETSDEPMVAVLVRPRDASTGEWIEVRRGDGHTPFASLGVASVFAVAHLGSGSLNLRGATPPKGSAAERAWKRVALARNAVRVETRDAESWQHVGIDGSWHCEAVALPKASRAPREVLCLMRRPNAAR